MSEPTIPVALDPHGNPVPIEEAIRFKTDYYECPECCNYLSPRKGSKRIHFYAHQRGELDNDTCSLSTQADVDKIVDRLRTSDVEKDERSKKVRLFLRMVHDSQLELFGILPSLDWEDIPPTVDTDRLINEITVESNGLTQPVANGQFHPTEPEVVLQLNAGSKEFSIQVDGPEEIKNLRGNWTAEGIAPGDLFVGDQGRARRRSSNKQVRDGEWAYIVVDAVPESLPDEASVYSLTEYQVLSFPVQEETQALLSQYTEESSRDDYGFDADIVLPSQVHPTAQGPVEGKVDQQAMVCITPAEEIDPVFEVIPVPRGSATPVEIEPTGPGNPRYYTLQFPSAPGSKRVSIHQRNSSRHRLVHFHATNSPTDTPESDVTGGKIGLQLTLNSSSVLLSPLSGEQSVTLPEEFDPLSLPQSTTYLGPEGLEFEITAKFEEESAHGPTVRRTTTDIESTLPDIGHWLTMDCYEVSFRFGNLGSAVLEVPTDSTEVDSTSVGVGE